MATQSPSIPAGDEPLSVTVVRAIAAHEGVDPMDLSPPLFRSLDPAALDSLFEPTTGGVRSGSVAFTYDGKRVTVESSGEVTVESATSSNNYTPSDSEQRFR